MKNKTIAITSLLLFSCGPTYVKDPNANTLLTVSYNGEAPRIVRLPGDKHNKQYDCKNKKGAECATALYNASESFMEEGKKLEVKTLYLSAMLSYMQALTRLSEAKIRLERSKTDNYEDYKVAVVLGLEKKIQERIRICNKKINYLQWKR